MSPATPIYSFEQIHVDIARNTTDDFNPFHDPHRWHRVRDNPFGGTIVLGFQLAALADSLIELHRQTEPENPSRTSTYINYEFHYAAPLRPGEPFTVDVRHSIHKKTGTPGVLNRVILRKQTGQPILLGSRTDTTQPAFADDWPPLESHLTDAIGDRAYLPEQHLFLKRKYLSTNNGKNFLLGSLVDQYFYFDELSERVRFPPMFTAALISCALLEQARAEGYDFEGDPQVYVSHRITVDQRVQQALRSNDRLDLLVDTATQGLASQGRSQTRVEQQTRHCLGIVAGRGVLFRAQVQLASLRAILGR
jgi:acyl dehydratase